MIFQPSSMQLQMQAAVAGDRDAMLHYDTCRVQHKCCIYTGFLKTAEQNAQGLNVSNCMMHSRWFSSKYYKYA